MHITWDAPHVRYAGDTHMAVVPGRGVPASVGVTGGFACGLGNW